MNGTALILSILLVGYSPGPANLFALADPGANLAWLLAGSYLRRLFVRHLAVTNTILAFLLAACALWIAIL